MDPGSRPSLFSRPPALRGGAAQGLPGVTSRSWTSLPFERVDRLPIGAGWVRDEGLGPLGKQRRGRVGLGNPRECRRGSGEVAPPPPRKPLGIGVGDELAARADAPPLAPPLENLDRGG